MKVRAEEKGFNFPYLYDETQQIARDLKATVTPEFYVFDKDRKLVYWGPLDSSKDSASTATPYLAEAVDALVKGEAVPTSLQGKKAKGCQIQYENK
jgi:hypothetical protein